MGKVNAKGMTDFEAKRRQRKASLRALIATPFDRNNEEQQKALKKYIDEFELFTNQMYVYQFIGKGASIWMGSFVVTRFLPIPEFINSLFSIALYLGVAARILEHFSMRDFNAHLKEMKTLYNWCLKNNNLAYSPEIDNTEVLKYPMIQRLIKLLAPLCDTEFMIAWPRETEHQELPNGNWTRTMKAGYSALSATLSIFSRKGTQPTVDQNRIKELKVNVETRSLDRGTFNGFSQAVEYFSSSAEFGGLLKAKLQKPRALLQGIVPEIGSIMDTVSPHSS